MRRKKLRGVNLIGPGKFEEIQKNMGGFGEIVPKDELNFIKQENPPTFLEKNFSALLSLSI